MNILLDFITFKWQTGAGEYARRVYSALLQKIKDESIDATIYALYDSSVGIAYPDMRKGESMTQKVMFLDVALHKLTELVDVYKIDVFFIACAQYVGKYPELQEIKCRAICVIHDLAYEEMFVNKMDYYFKFLNPKYKLGKRSVSSRDYICQTFKLMKWFYDVRRHHDFEQGLSLLNPIINLVQRNQNTQLITVSEYTRTSLQYHYGLDLEDVKVLYSPERVYIRPSTTIENEDLANMIKSGDRYVLMLSANRNTKNPHKAIRAFKRYAEIDQTMKFIVVGYSGRTFENLLSLPYLSDSDLSHAIQNCYALVYPTFFEGFGYPVIEAMHYKKPVLASNVTSIPEIFEDAPIYFSPIYETEIFNALTKLTGENYVFYSNRSEEQYKKVRERQEQDLAQLIEMITNC